MERFYPGLVEVFGFFLHCKHLPLWAEQQHTCRELCTRHQKTPLRCNFEKFLHNRVCTDGNRSADQFHELREEKCLKFFQTYFLSQGFVNFRRPLTSQLRRNERPLLFEEEHEGIGRLLDVRQVIFELRSMISFSTTQKQKKTSGLHPATGQHSHKIF